MNFNSKIICFFALFTGCSLSEEGSSLSSKQTVDRDRELVEHIVFDIVDPKVKSFQSHLKQLSSQVGVACQGSDNEVPVKKLKEFWFDTMMDFHYLEVLAFGPLGAGDGVVKKKIYSLPVKEQSTLIDKEIEIAFQRGSGYRQSRIRHYLIGLDAIEYVFFGYLKGVDRINSENIACNYLVFIMEKLDSQVKQLAESWQIEEVDFLKSPEGQTRMRESLKRITDSLVVFADKGIKDQKVRDPIGRGADCPENNCAELYLEHPFSKIAKDALVGNLRALSDVLSGKTMGDGQRGFGYDSYLFHLGISKENRSMIVHSRFLLDEWEVLPGGEDYFNLFAEVNKSLELGQSLPDNKIVRLYGNLKKLTDWLKEDFIAYLNTGLPGTVQGDND